MPQKLENGKGDQGSVKVGATGKVSTLMTRELDSLKHSSSNSESHKKNHQSVPVSVCCGGVSARKTVPSSSPGTRSSMSNNDKRIRREGIQRNMHNSSTASHIPMLASEDVSIDRTPVRGKLEKKRSQLVEIVDLKCGRSPEKSWSSSTSNNRKNVKFSRLSLSS